MGSMWMCRESRLSSNFSVLIVCHVVDHYGDAGVCLRLAKGLAARQCRVQLVIDQPALIAKMSPTLTENVRVTEGLTALEARAAGLPGHRALGRDNARHARTGPRR